MRRFRALARSAAQQALAEPLSAILFLVAPLAVYLAPVFHYHQFGEPARLARECGFSALLVFGLVFATSAAVKAIGGEIASGTAAIALARPVSRPLFLVSRLAGVAGAFALFAVAVCGATLLAMQNGETGAVLLVNGEPMRIWRAGLAWGVGGTLAAFVGAALANRFARVRFCRTACLAEALAQPLACVGAHALGPAAAWGLPCVPALALLACGCLVFIVLAGALSVRLKPAAVAAATGLAAGASFLLPALGARLPSAAAALGGALPDLTRFWLVERLAAGAAPGPDAYAPALGAAACLVALWLGVGCLLLHGKELP